MNGTYEALKQFNELTDDIEVLLNGIENMPRPIINCYGEMVNYNDSFNNNYDDLDEYICSKCDEIYEKYEKNFAHFMIDYNLEASGKYLISIKAKIILDEYYNGYGELTYYNQFTN